MNKKTLGYLLTSAGLVILVLGLFIYANPSTLTQTETLAPLESKTVQLELGTGDRVQGAVTVDEGNSGITVYIENPNGETSYNGGTVYNNVEFSFNAQTAGRHIAIITNLSPTNQQTIQYTFTYPAAPAIASIAVIIAGLFLILTGVSMIVILRKAAEISKAKPLD